MSKNTLTDLKHILADRYEATIDGRTFNAPEGSLPRIPHMLGITPLDEEHDATDEDGTLLDPSHHFWDDFEKNVKTRNRTRTWIRTATDELVEDGVLDVTERRGYYLDVTVNFPEESASSCPECSAPVETDERIELSQNNAIKSIDVSCPICGLERTYERTFTRR